MSKDLYSIGLEPITWNPLFTIDKPKNNGVAQVAFDVLFSCASFLGLNYLASAYWGIWFHELGHTLAFKACYQGPWPTIIVRPFEGGSTVIDPWTNAPFPLVVLKRDPRRESVPRPLTNFGSFLGERSSLALVTAGGPLASLAIVCLALASKRFFRGENQRPMRRLLDMVAIVFTCRELWNGLLFGHRSSNDLVRFENITGVPRMASLAFIVAPVACHFLLKLSSSKLKS